MSVCKQGDGHGAYDVWDDPVHVGTRRPARQEQADGKANCAGKHRGCDTRARVSMLQNVKNSSERT